MIASKLQPAYRLLHGLSPCGLRSRIPPPRLLHLRRDRQWWTESLCWTFDYLKLLRIGETEDPLRGRA